MENIVAKIQGNKLLLEIDLEQTLGNSKSGKSIVIATTGGNVSVPGRQDVKIGINCYKPVRG